MFRIEKDKPKKKRDEAGERWAALVHNELHPDRFSAALKEQVTLLAIKHEIANHELQPLLQEVINEYLKRQELDGYISLQAGEATLRWRDDLEYPYRICLSIDMAHGQVIIRTGQKGTHTDTYCFTKTIPYSYQTWVWTEQVRTAIQMAIKERLTGVSAC
jgi:hypothetical protein